MNSTKGYLLDTSTMIDHLRGRKKVTSFIEEIAEEGETVGCCCINVAEIHAGMREKERDKTEQFIESLYYFEVTREAAALAGELKREYAKKGITLSTADTIIAAVCMVYQLILVTENVKHFPYPNLTVINPLDKAK